MKKSSLNWHKIIFIFLILAFLGVSMKAFLFWMEMQKFEPAVYYYVPPERSFIYSAKEIAEFGIEEYVQERIIIERAKLIEGKRSFIDLDLKEMKLTLYKEGEVFEIFPVQSKGRKGSWWETAPGVYFVGDKVANHFSSISRVWMPYVVQFYGNFFIHGWPYYSDGRMLPPGPSGGCVRLKTRDAAVVFEFTERGMPVLVFEEKIVPLLPALHMVDEGISFPEIKGQALLIADLNTGEILLNKEMDSEIYAGPVVGGMMALTASEVVNLERRITARPWMIEEIKEGIIVPERSYRGYDLLYPLLGQSSKEAALVLSRFFTPEYFVIVMNIKAGAIGMNNTSFVDVTGTSKKNITTLYDVARMARYIKEYRGFIFEISKELAGLGENEKETIFTVWEMKTLDDVSRIIFIGLANSVNAKEDVENILLWLDNSFGLK